MLPDAVRLRVGRGRRPHPGPTSAALSAVAWLVAGVGVLAEVVAARSVAGWDDPRRWLPDLLAGWAVLAAGLLAQRGVDRTVPILLVATSGLWFLGTAVPIASAWHRAPLIHVLAGAPLRRPRQLLRTAVVAVAYPAVVLLPGTPGQVAAVVLTVAAVLVRLIGRHDRAAPWTLWVPAAAGTCWASVLAVGVLVAAPAAAAVLLSYELAVCMVAAACTASALSSRLESLPDRVVAAVELGMPGVGALQEELRRFSSDPSVVVAVWDAARAGFVDGEGCTIPQQSSGRRSVTVTDDDGRPLALVLHGGSLPEGTQLADAVRATVSLIASHAALRGALAERVEDVRRSGRRLLVAADAERHALSRQLALGPGSRLADLRRRIADVGTEEVLPPVTAELAAATRHLEGAADDLASIAAGLRPAELDDGLAPALAALADRSPVRVTLELQLAGAVPTEVATAAYYVAAEALANVAKHARATFVRLATFTVLENSGDVLVVRVTDDGTGDVRSKEGGGILGLADRAAALGGVVTALGSRGGGTVVEARLPIRPASSAS